MAPLKWENGNTKLDDGGHSGKRYKFTAGTPYNEFRA